ncbi:MAG TPA: PHB depolymerase family esterase [Planktothrix sp.]
MKCKRVSVALIMAVVTLPASGQSTSTASQNGTGVKTQYVRRTNSIGGMTLRRPSVPAQYYQSKPVDSRDRQAQAAASNYARQTGVTNYTAAPVAVPATSRSASTTSARPVAVKAHDYADSMMVGGIRRTFRVHLPQAVADKSHPVPVVLVFHGIGMTGQQMVFLSNMNDYGDKNGFAVVYPDGVGHRWNTDAADVEFVDAIIDRLARNANVDRRHVYAAGFSNGGHFVQYLATADNRIAAIAVVAAGMLEGTGGGSNAVPAIFFLGTDDPLVPSTDPEHNAELGKLGDKLGIGGLGSLPVSYAKIGGMMTAEETIDYWCRRNGCSLSGVSTQMPDRAPNDGTKVTRTTYGGGHNEVVYYRIQGGGHAWPGSFWSGASKDILGRTSDDVLASELIADFFMSHR